MSGEVQSQAGKAVAEKELSKIKTALKAKRQALKSNERAVYSKMFS